MPTYLWHPDDVLKLPANEAVRLGLLREGTYDGYVQQAQAAGITKPRLIVLVCRKDGSTSTVAVNGAPFTFEPDDQCYPIMADEWATFALDEEPFCRAPLVVWAVDREKYTAPL